MRKLQKRKTSVRLVCRWSCYSGSRYTTHVPTADNRILPSGTAYITDVGMTGPYDGILGMDREAVLKKFLTNLPVRFEVTNGRTQLMCGAN